MSIAQQLGATWWIAMLAGDFEQAWRASDRIRELGAEDPHRFWQGEELAGQRVTVRCLHGFGDSVQFLRYLPMLKAKAATVCVEVAPRFVELARCFAGVDEVITWGENAPVVAPEWDVQIEVTELPYVFRTQLSDMPLATRYLRVLPARAAEASALQVGLMWTAGEWNPARGVEFALLHPLLAVAGCEFWNLTTTLAPEALLEDFSCRESLTGLASRIAALDLVISVDTVAAHLAGALGVPAFVLLQHEADWRWMTSREDSPWYPSLRLIRRGQDEGWDAVIERAATALRERAEERRARHE